MIKCSIFLKGYHTKSFSRTQYQGSNRLSTSSSSIASNDSGYGSWILQGTVYTDKYLAISEDFRSFKFIYRKLLTKLNLLDTKSTYLIGSMGMAQPILPEYKLYRLIQKVLLLLQTMIEENQEKTPDIEM